MAKVNLIEMHAMTDPALSFEFELVIPRIPGQGGDLITGATIRNNDVEAAIQEQYGKNLNSASILRIFAQTVDLPDKQIEPVTVQLTGGELVYAGMTKFTHEMAVNFPERRDYVVYKAINHWVEYCRAHRTQHGHYKSEYAVDCILRVFDQKSYTVDQFKLYSVWPSNVPSISYDSTTSNHIMINVTFQVDWFELEWQEESGSFKNVIHSFHQNTPD